MKEKYEQQRRDELEELKILTELKQLNMKEKFEMEDEMKKNKHIEELDQQQTKPVLQQLSAQELAERRLKEELAKKKKKEEEDKARLERLAEKMASDSRPAWKQARQRVPSPPIPTLRNKEHSQSPATNNHTSSQMPTNSSNVHAHQAPPDPRVHTPQLVADQYHVQNDPVPIDRHTFSPPIPTLRNTRNDRTPDAATGRQNNGQTVYQSEPTNDYRPLWVGTTRRESSHMTTAGQTQPEVVPPHNNHASFQRENSRELLEKFSDLKKHIRQTMTTTSATERTRQRNPVLKHNSNPALLPLPPPPPLSSAATLEQFNQLKIARPSEARRRFLNEFPDPPRSNTALEVQQEALLNHQRRG